MDRKQRYYKLLMASCLSIAVACTADIGGTGEASVGKHAILTRSELTATSAQFRQGDEVWVWATTATEPSTTYFDAWHLTADAAGQLTGYTQYWPENESSLNVKAVHGNFVGLVENSTAWSGSFTHSIAADQTEGNGYSSSDLLYCSETTITKDAENKLNFNHLLSKLILSIDLSQCEGITAADLNGAEVWVKNVKPQTSFSTSNGSVGSDASGDATDIKVGVISGLSDSSTDPIDIAVGILPPQTFAAGTKMITLRLPSGYGISLVPRADITLASGNAYKLTMKIVRKVVTGIVDVAGFDENSEHIQLDDGTGGVVQVLVTSIIDVAGFADDCDLISFPDGEKIVVKISLGCEIAVSKFDEYEYHTIVFDTDTPIYSGKAVEVSPYTSDGVETINITEEETQQQE